MLNFEARENRARLDSLIDKLILAGIVALITASIGSSIALAKLNTKFDILNVSIANIPTMQDKQAHLEERQIELYRRQDMDDVIHAELLQKISEIHNAHR
jgi:hypothetical protein